MKKSKKLNLPDESADAKDFNAHLQEAGSTDLSELERTGCVSQGRDNKNNHIIIMIPSLGLKHSEKPEILLRMMLLLFIRKANEIVGNPYAVVYAHTSLDIINQYPLIYKFYSILPHAYRKNLQKMYILHPTTSIKMFFEFARVFLNHKFYNKLCLLDSILEFQKIIPPTQLSFPLKFYRREDDDNGYKYHGSMAPLTSSFESSIGATKLIETCVAFIRSRGALKQHGLFRVAGDEIELNLAKIRLQYANSGSNRSNSRIIMSEREDYILIGDLERLLKPPTTSASEIELTESQQQHQQSAENVPMSIVLISNVDTVCQIMKMSIRDLPEPLVSTVVLKQLIDLVRAFEQTAGLNEFWEREVSTVLATLPYENLSTLVYIISFLREVASFSEFNSMDSNNLGIIFSPTVSRPETTDVMTVLAENKLTQGIIRELIGRPTVLSRAVSIFKDKHVVQLGLMQLVRVNPVMNDEDFKPAANHHPTLLKAIQQQHQSNDSALDQFFKQQYSHSGDSSQSSSSSNSSNSTYIHLQQPNRKTNNSYNAYESSTMNNTALGGGGDNLDLSTSLNLSRAMLGRITKGSRGGSSHSSDTADLDVNSSGSPPVHANTMFALKSMSLDSGERLKYSQMRYEEGVKVDGGDESENFGFNRFHRSSEHNLLPVLEVDNNGKEDNDDEEDDEEEDVWKSVCSPIKPRSQSNSPELLASSIEKTVERNNASGRVSRSSRL